MSHQSANIARNAFVVGAMTFVSRLGGLIREQLMAAFFGTSVIKSAFDVAFLIPNLFRRLFGEGALSAAVIPIYTETLEKDGKGAADRFASRFAAVLLASLGVIAAGLILLTFPLARFFAGLAHADLPAAFAFLQDQERWQTIFPLLRIMLPYAPLQMLLFDYDDGIIGMPDCLVMTSANESGAPICRDDDDARAELGPLCDAILSHDRIIRMRADDTVLDLFEERPYMVRRSRGWAPLPFVISGGLGTRVLAVGGELKNSFCLGSGELVYPSPYVGDLSDVRTVRACEDAIDRFETLLEFEPEVVACDLHPRYNATLVAEELAAERGLPLVRVQHHYAHVASCMAENDYADPVIGISFDGTGYGTDGTIWGGEVLLSDYHGFERVGHIAPFAQVGGDLSAREGWRCAVSMLRGCCESDAEAAERAEALGLCTAAEARLVLTMAARGVNTVASTSCGRLFDAVSAVLGIRRASTYEGEAATQLQFAIQRCPVELRKQADADAALLREGGADGAFVLPTDELFAHIVADRESGKDVGHLAWSFHAELAALVVAACERVRTERGVATVALTGGCYQNTLLLALTVSALRERGFTVLTHSLVPPNDGGIALGQAVVAAQWMRDHAAPAQDQQQEHSK